MNTFTRGAGCFLLVAWLSWSGQAVFGRQDTQPATQSGQPARERAAREGAPDRPRQAERRAGADRRALAEALERIDLVRDVVYAVTQDAKGERVELMMDCASLKQAGGDALPAVVYIHGGGWSEGDKQAGLPLMIALAEGGYFAASINYRLSGVAPYPAAVHDCKAAIRFLRKHAEDLGIDPDRIGVWGHSAGGHLSALLGTSGDVRAMEGEVGEVGVSSRVQCVVDICGPTDLERLGSTRAGARFLEPWLGQRGEAFEARAKQATPMTHVDESDPPFFIVHGTADELVSIRHAEAFRDSLKAAGVPCDFLAIEGEGHAVTNPDAYRAMAAFFDKHLGGHAVEAGKRLEQARSDRPATRPGTSQ